MIETLHYKYTAEFARKVSREVLLRKLGWAFTLMVLGLIYLLWAFNGNKFLWGIAVTLVALYIILFIRNEKASVEISRSLADPSIAVTFDDNGIAWESIGHSSVVKWQRLHSVTKLRSAWLLSIDSENNYLALPADELNSSTKTLIEKKMAENHRPIK